jgi:hypothetical protein
MYKRLVLNQIQTPDGTILTSYHVHDYKTYIDKISGEEYMVDGGTYYAKRSINIHPYIEQSVYEDDPFEIVRQSLRWGTYGKDGNSELTWIKLCDMETDHILACLSYAKIDDMYHEFFWKELEYRKDLEK